MNTIRILANNENAQILVSDSKTPFHIVEPFHTIKASLLTEFLISWTDWIRQIDAVRSESSKPENQNYSSKLNEFSNYLSTLLFGNSLGSIELESVRFIVDLEFSALPFEILQKEGSKIIRTIRSDRQPPSGRRGEGHLYIENHFNAETLLNGMQEERAEILKIWNENRVDSKQLVGFGLTKNRLLEKLSSKEYIHYSGHSYREGIYLSDDAFIDAQTIASFDLSNVELIYFNSCSSATLLATAFLQSGAKAVVGFLGEVRNDVASDAGKLFWSEYFKSKSSSSAVAVVRRNLEKKFGQGYPGAYQLVHFGESNPANRFGYIERFKRIYALGIILTLAIVVYSKFFSQDDTKYQKVETVTDTVKNSSERNHSKAIRNNSKEKIESIDIHKENDQNLTSTNLNLAYVRVDQDKEISKNQEKSKIGNLERFLDQHHSEELKKEVYDYLNDKSSISVSKEKREEELIRILTTEEDSELIRYRLRQLRK